jgi:hypothetical protein
VRHLEHKRPAFWKIFYGVYQAACLCVKYFTATVEGVALRAGYTDAVRQKVVDLLIRDHLSVYKIQRHLKEDFCLEVSVGFIYDCFRWAYDKIDRAEYWLWVLKNFSGVLCIDEVYDSGRAILVATDPLNDFTVAFHVVEHKDQPSMNAFLDSLKARGLKVQLAITDGSPLYKKALIERWRGLEHQLCLFHFLRDAMKHVFDAIRRVRHGLPVNPPHRRGRPSKRGRKRKDRRWRQKLLWENEHLIVKKRPTRSERRRLRELYKLDPRLATLRRFVERLHHCFERGITQQGARNRRTRLLKDRRFQSEPLLAGALQMLADDSTFEKLIVYMAYTNADRTNNHVERSNRAFRMVQKTRYKRRRSHTIDMAYWLHLERDWLDHPLRVDPTARPRRLRRRPRKRRHHARRLALTKRSLRRAE